MGNGPQDNTAKNIAYTITAGFYPELASRVKFGGMQEGKHGAAGAKYAMQRGFSDSSIRRVKREIAQQKADIAAGGTGRSADQVGGRYAPDAFNKRTEYSYISKKTGKQIHVRRKKEAGYAAIAKEEPSKYWSKAKKASTSWLGFGKGGGAQHLSSFAGGFGEGTPVSKADALSWSPELDKKTGRKEGKKRAQFMTYDKWMGGSEMYRLYGSKVWYQAGLRERESLSESLKLWGEAIEGGDTAALPKNFLNNIYTRDEENLVALATTMATELFDNALNDVNLRDDLKRDREQTQAAEEDPEPIQEGVMKEGYARMTREGNIEMDKRSLAKGLDLLTKTKDGQDLFLDSTEVGLTESTGHGVLKGSDDPLMKEIKKAIDGAGPGEKGERKLGDLRKLIQELFISNIKNDYNPAIREMRDFAKANMVKGEKKDEITFKNVLNAVDRLRAKNAEKLKKAKEAGRYKGRASDIRKYEAAGRDMWSKYNYMNEEGQKIIQISKQNIANAMGVTLKSQPTSDSHTHREAWTYIVHMLASLGDGVGRNFRQGHRLATFENNEKLYASVPMAMIPSGPRAMEFYQRGEDRSPMGTTILQGESHLMALGIVNNAIDATQTATQSQRQFQARSNSMIVGSANGGSKMNIMEKMSAHKTKVSHPATVVTFSPKKLNVLFETVMGQFQNGTWGDGMEDWTPPGGSSSVSSKLRQYTRAWPKKPIGKGHKSLKAKQQKLSWANVLEGAKFWALPYVGINDNIYRGKGHMQK